MHFHKLLFAVFALSGFAGIIYESIWSHYLKLVVGHAAYAQSLVLILFMGGMAGGAWLGARFRRHVSDSLRAYGYVELAIGLLAFAFHPIYTVVIDTAYTAVFPSLSPGWAMELAKFGICAALLLPQSVLLGLTFPLMVVGILERRVLPSGYTVASLYFVNSLGAAVGVLVSGFWLVSWFDLPGTVSVAGALNVLIALTVMRLGRGEPGTPFAERNPARSATATGQIRALMLLTAAFTGLASFVYEIVWIRMLNLVLGASTHSFELMLSAFILGLALGGRWIRRRLDSIEHPLAVLGFIQLAMASFAALTLPMYDFSFTLMSGIFHASAPTAAGYTLFMILSSALVLLVMLPTTFCAGMTLPLITQALLQTEAGERSVGEVYAANTIGAIAGVLLAVHVLIPMATVKGALLSACALDLMVGALLIWRGARTQYRAEGRAAAFAAVAVIAATAVIIQLDPRVLASAVFRFGITSLGDETQIDLHRYGKTATVTVYSVDANKRSIATNGKVDASIALNPAASPTIDEGTQVLAGALPFSLEARLRSAAIIGMGSGMTSQVVLQAPAIEVVDTIEIEAAMVAGAELFRPHVDAVFDDPRSHIHIDDARSYFAARSASYDLIISEPSNPWVSGVAGLYTTEFYRLVKTALNDGGVFAQWLQTYALDYDLVTSVFKAFAAEFPRYAVFEMGDGNLLLVARPGHAVEWDSARVIDHPGFKPLLARIGITTAGDLDSRYVGNSDLLSPLFQSRSIRANSDYAPVLALNAAAQRFLRRSSRGLTDFLRDQLPVREMLGGVSTRLADVSARAATDFATLSRMAAAKAIVDRLFEVRTTGLSSMNPEWARKVRLLKSEVDCEQSVERALWLDTWIEVGQIILPFVDAATRALWIEKYRRGACVRSANAALWDTLMHALALRDGSAMAASAQDLLSGQGSERIDRHRVFLVKAVMLGNIAAGLPDQNIDFYNDLPADSRKHLTRDSTLQLLRAYSGLSLDEPY